MEKLRKILTYYKSGKRFVENSYHKDARKKTLTEQRKHPKRTEIINYLLSSLNRETSYLEIGVRDPGSNYNHILADIKYSVDPGLEYKENPVDFKLTSDEFFEELHQNKILSKDIKFDVIFIDGLHLAEQVDRDIRNSSYFIKDDGFIILHDCNPPTQWHAREEYYYDISPAMYYWNGTTWKAFLKWRCDPLFNSCCIDSDWGVGILTKKYQIGKCVEQKNPFFEFSSLASNRKQYLNLMSFEEFKKIIASFYNK
jgi:hypothetical protein